MTVLGEGDLQVEFGDAIDGRKFDAEYGLSHCMKAVDFIVEFDDRYLFIEFKDPQQPLAREGSRSEFIAGLKQGTLDFDLRYKFRDTFLYEWASGRPEKPVYFYVLIAVDELNARDLAVRTDALRRALPVSGPDSNPWSRPFVSDCAAFNLESWNRTFSSYQVRRLSDSSGGCGVTL